MRIGIDVHHIGSTHSGNESFNLGIIKGLVELDKENQYCLYLDGRQGEEMLTGLPKNFSLVPLKFSNSLTRLSFSLPWAILRDRLDIFHADNFMPLYAGPKTVLTVHDLIFLEYPELFTLPERIILKNIIQSLKRARAVVTLSNYSKQKIIEFSGINPDKVRVIGSVCRNEFRKLENPTQQDEGFILYVGRLNARKNIILLLRAYKNLGGQEKLVLVGTWDWKKEDIKGEIERLGIKDKVIIKGYVSEKDLIRLYNQARVFVYVSLAEGFGLPVVEAMACGAPVVCSNNTAMAEVAGKAAMLVDPYNTDDITSGMRRVLEDRVLREDLIRRGFEIARQYRSEKIIVKLMEVYRWLGNQS